jgi:hypothetical protein
MTITEDCIARYALGSMPQLLDVNELIQPRTH